MGAGASAGRHEPDRLAARLTLADLRRWEDHGASWRAVEVAAGEVTVELCTCYGEPVDLTRGTEPELVAYVRQRRSSDIELG